MRVLYVTGNSFLRSTTSSLDAILRELRPQGLEPVLVFREPGPWEAELRASGVPCYFDALRVPGRERLLASLRDVYRLSRLVRRHRIDLIHCNEHEHYPLMRLVARFTRRPIAATLHWNIEEGYARWAFRSPYVPACLQFLSRVQMERARPLLPAEVGPGRIKLLMSGFAIDEFLARGDDAGDLRTRWGASDDTVVLGTASAIRPRKRIEDFVRLVGMLRKRGLTVMGVVAGGGVFADDAYLESLRRLIGEEGLERHCLMVGNVHPVTPFFQAIDISVNTCEMEILSMSLCEAQACGKPTVAYDVGGNSEALPERWCVAPFGDLGAMADRVEKLVVDREFRQRLGASAARHVRANFDAPVLAQRQLSIYEEVLGLRASG